jgi:hypothetical protein
VGLLSSRWTPATVLEEVALPRLLEGLLACETFAPTTQEIFFFCKRLTSLLVVARDPPVSALLFVARMHVIYLQKLRVSVLDNTPQFLSRLQQFASTEHSREISEVAATLRQI